MTSSKSHREVKQCTPQLLELIGGTSHRSPQAWASPPSPNRCESVTPPSVLVEYVEMERWTIPRAFLKRFFERSWPFLGM